MDAYTAFTKEIKDWAEAREKALREQISNPHLHEQHKLAARAKLDVITDLLNFISGNGE